MTGIFQRRANEAFDLAAEPMSGSRWRALRTSVPAHLQRCRAEHFRSLRVPRGTKCGRLPPTGGAMPERCQNATSQWQLWPRSVNGSALKIRCACSFGARRESTAARVGPVMEGLLQDAVAQLRSSRASVIRSCVFSRRTFEAMAGSMTSKVESQRFASSMIDIEPTLRCMIFIRMVDVCRQLCLPGRSLLELQHLLVLTAACVLASAVSPVHNIR
jgi:hypothetical protein